MVAWDHVLVLLEYAGFVSMYPCHLPCCKDHLKHNVMKSKANSWVMSNKTVRSKYQPFERPVFSGVGRHCSQHLLSRAIWSCIIKVILPCKYNLLPVILIWKVIYLQIRKATKMDMIQRETYSFPNSLRSKHETPASVGHGAGDTII